MIPTEKHAELKIQQIILPAHTLFFLARKLFTACYENVVSAAPLTLSSFVSLKYEVAENVTSRTADFKFAEPGFSSFLNFSGFLVDFINGWFSRFSFSSSKSSFSFKRDCKSSLSISGFLVLPGSCENYNYLFTYQWKNVNEKLQHINSKDVRIFQIALVKLIGALYYWNYKETFTLVILALDNADYEFIFLDVGCNGRILDSEQFRNSALSKFHSKALLASHMEDILHLVESYYMPFFFIGSLPANNLQHFFKNELLCRFLSRVSITIAEYLFCRVSTGDCFRFSIET